MYKTKQLHVLEIKIKFQELKYKRKKTLENGKSYLRVLEGA